MIFLEIIRKVIVADRVQGDGYDTGRAFLTARFLSERDSTCKLATRTDTRQSYQLERSNLGKVNLQLVANEEYQDRTQGRENNPSRMKSWIGRARKHVRDSTADDRSDDAENDRPEDRHMHMHDRFRDKPQR